MTRFSTFILILLVSFSADLFAQTPLEIFVNSRGTNSVKVFNENGDFIKDFITLGPDSLIQPEDIEFHPDGSVLLVSARDSTIRRYDGITGAYLGDFTYGYWLDEPVKMEIGPDSLLYVTQWGVTQNKVVRFEMSGAFVDEFTSINTPMALGHTWDDEGNFYLALLGPLIGTGTVHKFDTAGNDAGQFINTAILGAPTDIWFDTNGDMLVVDAMGGTVLRYDSTGAFVTIFLSGMTNPDGHAVMPNGDILVGDWGFNAIHLYDSLGGYWGHFISGSGLDQPTSIAIREAQGVSVNEIESDVHDLNIYPIINGSSYSIDFNLVSQQNLNVEVLSIEGRKVDVIANKKFTSGPQQLIWDNTESLAAGTYLIRIIGNNFQETKKVFID